MQMAMNSVIFSETNMYGKSLHWRCEPVENLCSFSQGYFGNFFPFKGGGK